jgi:hypothetical protein
MSILDPGSVVAVAISRLGDHIMDDGLARRRPNWAESCLSEHRGRRESGKLRNLVQIARNLNSTHPDYDDPLAWTIFHNTLRVGVEIFLVLTKGSFMWEPSLTAITKHHFMVEVWGPNEEYVTYQICEVSLELNLYESRTCEKQV